MSESMTLDAFRQHWTDALAAFGAHIEIYQLPEGIEKRRKYSAFVNEAEVDERPVRVVVVGRERVSGPVLVEMDKCRERIVQAFSAKLKEEERKGEAA